MAVPVTESKSGSASKDRFNVDIYGYPKGIDSLPLDSTLTAGDLHGNVMKLIWILIRHDAIDLSEGYFDSMWESYLSIPTDSQDWKPQDYAIESLKRIETFAGLLKMIEVKNPNFRLRLIGDVVADRGRSDFLTLKLLEQLSLLGIKYEIIYSNHDSSLFENYQKQLSKWKYYAIPYDSMQNLMLCLLYCERPDSEFKDWIKREEVDRLLGSYVLPQVKLIAYSLSADGKNIDLFMHAPNNYESIKKLFDEFHIVVPPEDSMTAGQFAQAIDELNEQFRTLYFPVGRKGCSLVERSAIYKFIWNRLGGEEIDKRKAEGKEYGVIDFKTYPKCVRNIIHGHTVTSGSAEVGQVNLDTSLGGDDGHMQGWYKFYIAMERVLKLKESPSRSPSSLSGASTALPVSSIVTPPFASPFSMAASLPQGPATPKFHEESTEEAVDTETGVSPPDEAFAAGIKTR